MVTKIKNLTSDTIDFGTFEVSGSGIAPLTWDIAIMTPEVFGKMLSLYDTGTIGFTGGDDVEVTEKVTSKYYTITQAGNRSTNQTNSEIDNLKVFLNEMYNQMVSE